MSMSLPASCSAGSCSLERPARLDIAFDWSSYANVAQTAAERDEMEKRGWTVDIEWVFDRLDGWGAAAEHGRSVHEGKDIHVDHVFRLQRGEERGVWTVHAFVRSSLFAPKHLTLSVEVKSEARRMADLRAQAFGALGAETTSAPHRFGIGARNAVVAPIRHPGAHDPDRDGELTRGELPAGFQERTAVERTMLRQEEIFRTVSLIGYLRHQQATGHGHNADAIEAAERRIEHLRAADTQIRDDETSGWQSFDLRGTYLSRNTEISSGPLDLYGAVRRAKKAVLDTEVEYVEVQVRDVSQRLGAENFKFTGHGRSFEEAFEAAFVDLCKTYPEGKVSVLAQAMDAGPAGSAGQARGMGKSIGFELATTSPWKRIKDKANHPVIQGLINIAATAIMIFAPPTAAVLVPFLAANNTINSLDDLYARQDNGTLSDRHVFLTLAQVGIDLLPNAGRALKIDGSRVFRAVEVGAQFAILYPQAQDQLREIQEQQVAAMANEYRDLLELERSTNGSDPRLAEMRTAIEQKAEAIRRSTVDVFTQAIGTQAIFMVSAHMMSKLGRKAEEDWVPSDLGTPLEETDWIHLDNHLEGRALATQVARPRQARAPQFHPSTHSTGSDTHETANLTEEQRAIIDDLAHLGEAHPRPGADRQKTAGEERAAAKRSHSQATHDQPAVTQPRAGRLQKEQSHASMHEQALIDGVSTRRASQQKQLPAVSPANDNHARAGEGVVDDFLTDKQVDITRWQNHGLEDDPRGQALLQDPVFRGWYDRWMSMPERLTVTAVGELHIKLPHGVPDAVAAQLRAVVENGNIGLTTRAAYLSERIAQALPGADLDPTAATWPEARVKLVELVGERAVAKYEREKTQTMGHPGREEIDRTIENALSPNVTESLARMHPGAEIYVTGSTVQAKTPKLAGDVDVVIVVADSTPLAIRAEMEQRLRELEISVEAGSNALTRKSSADANKTATLSLDPKVMTRSQFAGWSMTETPGRTTLANVRIESNIVGAPIGTGRSGVDVHNHMLGVNRLDYYINAIGRGSSLDLLDKAWTLVDHPDLKASVRAELTAARSDILNGHQAGLTHVALESRARRALERVLSASETVRFDETYDLRDLLVQTFIDPRSASNPDGRFPNHAFGTMVDLHDEGITASEQSVSISKLDKRFAAATMVEARQRAKNAGHESDLRFLAMLSSEQNLSGDARPLDDVTKANLRRVLARKDVKGIDFAGPEAHLFTEGGMSRFAEIYELARETSVARGESVVVRPHVGEGYDPHGTGEHVQVATRNLELLIATLERLGYRPGNGVVVRFGHATHATPDQLQRIQRLGVIAEANVGSNIATGSIIAADDHPLLANIYYGVPTLLATDGQGVMNTTLVAEYQRAAALIERFRAGVVNLKLGDKTIEFKDLTPVQKARFSVGWLEQQAVDYADVNLRRGGS